MHPLDSKVAFIIIACDGIWDCLSSEQATFLIRQKLSEGKSPSQTLSELFDQILAKLLPGQTFPENPEGTDNMSAVLLVFKDLPEVKPGFFTKIKTAIFN